MQPRVLVEAARLLKEVTERLEELRTLGRKDAPAAPPQPGWRSLLDQAIRPDAADPFEAIRAVCRPAAAASNDDDSADDSADGDEADAEPDAPAEASAQALRDGRGHAANAPAPGADDAAPATPGPQVARAGTHWYHPGCVPVERCIIAPPPAGWGYEIMSLPKALTSPDSPDPPLCATCERPLHEPPLIIRGGFGGQDFWHFQCAPGDLRKPENGVPLTDVPARTRCRNHRCGTLLHERVSVR